MRLNRLVSLFYILGTLLILLPFLDLGANLWPWAPNALNWRYGAYGILSGVLLTPFMGLLLILVTGVAADHGATVRLMSVLAWLVGALLVGSTVIYGLDAVQLRVTVPAEARDQFRIGTMKALVKNVVVALALLWTGWVAWSAARTRPGRGHRS